MSTEEFHPPDQGGLSRCGSRVNSEKSLSLVRGKIFDGDLVFCMTLDKSVVFRRCGEERLHPVYFKFHLDLAGKALLEFTERYIDIFLRTERGADGCKQMGVPRSNRMLIVQLQVRTKAVRSSERK